MAFRCGTTIFGPRWLRGGSKDARNRREIADSTPHRAGVLGSQQQQRTTVRHSEMPAQMCMREKLTEALRLGTLRFWTSRAQRRNTFEVSLSRASSRRGPQCSGGPRCAGLPSRHPGAERPPPTCGTACGSTATGQKHWLRRPCPAQQPPRRHGFAASNGARSRTPPVRGRRIRLLVADFRIIGRPVARKRHRKSHVDRKPVVPPAFAVAIRIRLDVSALPRLRRPRSW
jgi:hypothetical protein